MKRNVIEINEEKCVGCGLCASACMQGAIEMIDGKAKLVSDSYCDGLGMCLPKCPVDAIQVVEKEVEAFNPARKNIKAQTELQAQPKAQSQAQSQAQPETLACGCSGTMAKKIDRSTIAVIEPTLTIKKSESQVVPSELMQWPVQLRLVSPNAPYFENAHLLIAADCTAFAYGDFHRDFIKGKITVIGCPKLDDNGYNTDKIAEILSQNLIKSITVVRMEVPCCGGMIQAVKSAMLKAQCIIPYTEVTISSDGKIVG